MRMRAPARAPELPQFREGSESLDAYLLRFERIAKLNNWPREDWAGALSVLLSGKGLETYSSLTAEEAADYDTLKMALLKRYELTEEGYRARFRQAKPEKHESPVQFVRRLHNYFQRWVELSRVPHSADGLTELFLKEQFLNSCSKELVVHLKLNDGPLSHLANCAEVFLSAHGKSLGGSYSGGQSTKLAVPGIREEKPQISKPQAMIECFTCHRPGHRAKDCPSSRPNETRKCYLCSGEGHLARQCKLRKEQKSEVKAGGALIGRVDISSEREADPELQVARAEQTTTSPKPCNDENPGPHELTLADGSKLKVVRSGGGIAQEDNGKMPVASGFVGDEKVQVLRDTGCSGIVVKSKFVRPDQFTGEFGYILRIDNTVVEARKAIIEISTPFLRGQVQALCLHDALYDLVIGNVSGAEKADFQEGNTLQAASVTTRAQSSAQPTHLRTRPPSPEVSCVIDRQRLIELQRADSELSTSPKKRVGRTKGKATVDYRVRNGVHYRVFSHPHVDYGKERWQVLVPRPLRAHVLKTAHESLLGGHMGVQKTTNRILLSFYWPGIHGDIKRFCQSCDVCQRTVKKGGVPKAPLGKTPVIEVPFKRVAVDLIGPISPASDEGHRFILTLVDYATRYPEAVPLKRIDSETVAEALVSIFCRIGFPEEILSDLGTQFVSECMAQVARLLSIRQLTTAPYNPACNGLVERFNGTLKTMLRRLCSEQPKLWPRFLGPLLFAYREVPQDSTGFSPFELIYGRNVRGPMQILKRLWTEEDEDERSEVRSSYQYVLELRDRLEATLELAREQLQAAQGKQKAYADRGTRLRSFSEGDEVLILLPTDQNKLLMQWKGPYPIAGKLSAQNYRVLVKGKEKTYHVNLLKKYTRRVETPSDREVNGILQVASVAVIEDGIAVEEGEVEEELLPLLAPVSKETGQDVKFADDLSDEQRRDLESLVARHYTSFTDRPGECTVAQHRIKLSSNQPVVSRPYAVPHSLRESLKADLEEMQNMGIIRPSDSPYASPVVIVKKRDGSNRICIDFRKLNQLTEVDPEPMPPLKEVVQSLGGNVFFSKLDMSKGYWQLKVAPEDVPKTAFVTQFGKFESLRMPFGMVNSGATLTRCLRGVLTGMDGVTNYLDDILVHTKSWEEHVRVLEELLNRLREAGLTVRPSKCELGARVIDFLGHRVGSGRVELLSDNARKIANAARPQTKKEVRSFIGLCNFYRDFIPQYATIAAPLTDLTKNGRPNRVKWEGRHEAAYRTLKAALSSQPILRLAEPSRKFVLRTDASDVGLGAVLCQEFDDGIFPISYASRKLLDRERRYSVLERECLALVWAIKKFSVFLYDQDFVLQTDHQPLIYLNRTKFENNRVMRWALFLQGYRFSIEAIKGRDNVAADFLSRVQDGTSCP